MNNWNQLLRESVAEFRGKPKTVTIKIKQRKDARMLFGKIVLGFFIQAVLFVCWLTNKDATSYLIFATLFGIGYDLWLLRYA